MRERWRRPKDYLWPYFLWPVKVRILLYADGSIRFNGGSFQGLQHVLAALAAEAYSFVQFEVTTAHRATDPSADEQNRKFTDFDLPGSFDQVWLFGISSATTTLDAAEKTSLESFMDGGGGVLTTGDHASLGLGLASIKRVREMRAYPAPDAAPPAWNNTLRDANGDGVWSFSEQSDDTPQPVRLKWSYRFSSVNRFIRRRVEYPHPVLCGPDGPIRVFPDHQHEGEALAPTSLAAKNWPSVGGNQPRPEVVAWGRIEAVDADAGREFGLVSVYDGHVAGIGRIIADATWHHWFDINLDGFDTSPSGQGHLRQIEAYFVNCGIWLARANQLRRMRNALCVKAVWLEPLIEFQFDRSRSVSLFDVGILARDAAGRLAPQCQAIQWVLDLIPFELRDRFRRIPPPPAPFTPLPWEEAVLGAIFDPLLRARDAGKLDPDTLDMSALDKIVDDAFADAPARAALAITSAAKEAQSHHEAMQDVLAACVVRE